MRLYSECITAIAFAPELDHLSVEGAWEVDDARAAPVSPASAAREAVEALRPAFGVVLDAYAIPERIEGGLGQPDPDDRARDRVAAMAALDYFTARSRPPLPPACDLLSPRRRAIVRTFLRERLEGWAAVERPRTAGWEAVLRWVPDPWIPPDRLRRAILRDGVAEAYGDVEVSFELHPPGGARWVRERTLDEWPALRARLDAGQPVLVDLLGESRTGAAADAATVVAYAYEEKGLELTLHVYRPGAGPRGRRLRFDLGAQALDGRFVEPGEPLAVVRGFRCVELVPRAPPVFGVTALLRLLRLNRIAWSLARWRARRRLSRSQPG